MKHKGGLQSNAKGSPMLADRPAAHFGPPDFEKDGAPLTPLQTRPHDDPAKHRHGFPPFKQKHPAHGKPAHRGHTIEHEVAKRNHPNFPYQTQHLGPGGAHSEPDGDEISPVTGGGLPMAPAVDTDKDEGGY